MTVDMSQHFGWRQLLKFTAPSIAMMVFTSIYGIVDGLFVSNFVGKSAFAAVNLIMPFIMILSATGFMLGTGGAAIVGKVRGEGDDARANRYFSFIVYATMVIGTVLALAGAALAEPVARAMGAEGEILAYCVLYCRIAMITLPLFMLQYVFQSFFAVAGKPDLGFYVVVAAGVANMALDALFVGVLNWGIAGAALATNFAELLGGGLPLIYFFRKNSSCLRLGRTGMELRVLGRASVNGSSEMMANVAMSAVAILYNLQLMAFAGADGVAAYGVIMYSGMIFGAVFMGYSMGASSLMSYQYGANNRREMQNLLKKSLVFIGVTGIMMFAAGQTFAAPISAVFVGYDESLLELTTHGFEMYALSFLLMGFSIYGSAFFTSLNNGLVSALISFLRTLVFETAAVLLLPLIWGIDGIWLAVSVAELGCVIVTAGCMLALGGRYGYLPRREESARIIPQRNRSLQPLR